VDWKTHFQKASRKHAQFGAGLLSLPAYPGLLALSAADLQAIVHAAYDIGINPDWLATIINFESGGSFSPSKKNAAGSGATGLIQFMPSTAAGLLGTTPDQAIAQLEAMTFQQQLEIVKRYFVPYKGKLQSLADTYLAVLYPAFIGKDPDSVLGRSGDIIYQQNAGFDSSGKGYITKDDITSRIQGMLASMSGRMAVPGILAAERAVTILSVVAWASLAGVLGLAGYGSYRHHQKTGRWLPTVSEVRQTRIPFMHRRIGSLLPAKKVES
jgi:hypothetical protein